MPNNEKYIEGLELAEVDEELRDFSFDRIHVETEEESASIVGNAVISFTENVSGHVRADLKNSTCLAFLAAKRQHDPFNETEKFFRYYSDVLSNIGYVVQGFNFTKHEVSGSTFTVDKVVIEILRAYATGDEVALVEKSLKALEALSDDDNRFVLFSTSSHSAENGSFMLGVASQAENGDVAFKIGAFELDSNQNNKRFLWFSFSTSESKLFRATQSLLHNDDVYSRVRNQIIEKLGDRAERYIADLDIGEL